MFLSTTHKDVQYKTYHIKHICIKTIVNTSKRLVCVFSNVTDKHYKEQLNCCEHLRIWCVFKYVHFISLVYLILVNSTKTLTHDFAFLAHIFTNLVSHLIRFSYKLPNPTHKAPATGFVILVPGSQCAFLIGCTNEKTDQWDSRTLQHCPIAKIVLKSIFLQSMVEMFKTFTFSYP